MQPDFQPLPLRVRSIHVQRWVVSYPPSRTIRPFPNPYLGPALEDICSECGEGLGIQCDWTQMYKVRGFIQPSLSPESIFRPDYRKLRQFHERLVQSREGGSNDSKKRALEDYMEYLFEQGPGVKVRCQGLSEFHR